jgi:hypothetical protein
LSIETTVVDATEEGAISTTSIAAPTKTVTIRDNSPLSEWIATVFVITVLSVTERILPVFVREAKAL